MINVWCERNLERRLALKLTVYCHARTAGLRLNKHKAVGGFELDTRNDETGAGIEIESLLPRLMAGEFERDFASALQNFGIERRRACAFAVDKQLGADGCRRKTDRRPRRCEG